MKKLSLLFALLCAAALLLSLCPASLAAETEALDYALPENWAYYDLGEDKPVDVFLICPTVDTRSPTNTFDLNEKLKGRFISVLDGEKGIYEETGRLFSPYYRQMSINAYRLSEEERAPFREIAYSDISAAFRWYLENENDGRGIILAGFSQGADMCLQLMKDYFSDEQLLEQLVSVYAIGWHLSQEMTEQYPQIVPARSETDTGVVVSYDCEDGSLTGTIINPAGEVALSINPLNWKTDSTPADKALNRGAVMSVGANPIPELCGAYIGTRGELVVTGIDAADYPPLLDIFPAGSYHVYDNLFFFTNLKDNVAKRTAEWMAAQMDEELPAAA